MIIKLKSKDKLTVYRNYINFLAPIMKVSPQELDVLAMLMMKYNELKADVSNPEYINKLLFNSDTRSEIAEKLEMSKPRYDGIISRLRSMGVVKGKTLEKAIIPNLNKDGQLSVQVLIYEE